MMIIGKRLFLPQGDGCDWKGMKSNVDVNYQDLVVNVNILFVNTHGPHVATSHR